MATPKKSTTSTAYDTSLAPATPPAGDAPAPVAVPLTAGAAERLELPSGNWIDVRDAKSVKRSEKRGMLAGSLDDDDSSTVQGLKTEDALIAMLVVGWSFDAPLPSVDLDSLDVLDPADDAVVDAWTTRAWAILSPRKITPDDHADPTSPTAPSAG